MAAAGWEYSLFTIDPLEVLYVFKPCNNVCWYI
jgi:hypothetical protein